MFHKIVSKRFLLNLFILGAVLFLNGCGADSESTDDGVKIPGVEYISISSAKSLLSTAQNDSVIVTATVLDKNRGAISGADVTFSANTGILSSSKLTTDENGDAEITFRAGGNKANQTATIIASSSNEKSVSIPIPITGTTVEMELDGTSFIPGSSKTAKIIVKDAEENPVHNAEVILSQTGTGKISFADQTYTTDLAGEVDVILTGDQNGDVEFKAESLGFTASISLNVSGALADVFQITDPSQEIFSTSFDPANGFRVKEIQVVSPQGKNVLFYTTLGSWDSADSEKKSVTKSPVNNIAKAVLYSEQAGTATISVSEAGTNMTDSVVVAIAAPSNEASTITLTASPTVINPSSGGISRKSTLTAVVKNGQGQFVAGVPVVFEVQSTTGGGDYISPSIVFTDGAGVAKSFFNAGSYPSDSQGVKCNASINLAGGGVAEASTEILISKSGTGLVALGRATKIEVLSTTEYKYPMSVIVNDSNGNPAVNQKVYLTLWPLSYYTGRMPDDFDTGAGGAMVKNANEDTDRDEVMDSGEDVNNNGKLDPARATAGVVPPFVVTDENGVAQFDYIYQKDYAWWIETEITATTSLFGGEETNSSINFILPLAESESEDFEGRLSPFND
ncbi:MAG: Ig-like domain-containing protein [Desulforegulaceae bacterium]|nr:Ig-like domain-containing protein [Desulforegulaceae bacterium]